jgi:hypothetical protein
MKTSTIAIGLTAALAALVGIEAASAQAPDLRIYRMSARWQAPKVVLTYWYANWGRGEARKPKVRVYRTPDARRTTPQDDAVVRRYTFEEDVPGRAGFRPRRLRTISFDGPRSSGTYWYYICFEPVRGEINTRNNCSPVRRVVVPRGPGPDLRVRTWRVFAIRQGPDTVGMRIEVLFVNRGTGPSTKKHLRLFRQIRPGARQTVVDKEWRGAVPAVPAGGQVWVRVQYRFLKTEQARRLYRVCASERNPPYTLYCARRWQRVGR